MKKQAAKQKYPFILSNFTDSNEESMSNIGIHGTQMTQTSAD